VCAGGANGVNLGMLVLAAPLFNLIISPANNCAVRRNNYGANGNLACVKRLSGKHECCLHVRDIERTVFLKIHKFLFYLKNI
jgi:hypothetical protein